MRQHILAVYPHPDDESFGKGGALALHTKDGTPITLVCSTLGQMGRNMGKPFFANRETLPDIREKELQEACRALGIQDLRLLGLHDKMVEFEDPDYIAAKILEIIHEVRPTVIYTYYPSHGVHPDHDAMSAATVLAVSKLPEEQRPIIYASPISKDAVAELGAPDIELDVSPVYDMKLAAIRAHRSQSEAILTRLAERIAADPEKKEEIEAPLKRERYWIYKI